MNITINQRRGLWVLAGVLAVALCAGSVEFYTSFANSRFEQFYFFVMAVGLFAMTILAPSGVLWAWRKHWIVSLGAALLIVPLLFSLEIVSGVGLLKKAHQAKQLQGEHAKALAAEVKAKEAAAAQFGGESVNVAELQAQIAKNDAEIESLREIAAKCKKSNMLTNCHKDGGGMLSVAMVQERQRALYSQNSAAQTKIENAGKLVAVLEGKAQAQLKYAEAATTGGTGDIPQIFVTLGNFLNMSPMAARDLQIVLTQLLVQTCLAVLLAFLIHSEPAGAETVPANMQAVPQYRHGGAVTYHGLAQVHGTADRPEYVLSPEMTEQLGGSDLLEKLRQRVHGGGQPKQPVPIETATEDSDGQPVPIRTAGHSTATGQANLVCLEDAVFAAYMSGDLDVKAGRPTVEKFMRGLGYKFKTDYIIEAMRSAQSKYRQVKEKYGDA